MTVLSPKAEPNVKLDDITSDLLDRAIAIYLRLAYPDGRYPDVVAQRAALPAGRRGPDLLSDERFERVPPKAPPDQATRFNLRLGNAMYPNMKLGLDRVGDRDEFVLVVDTHDRLFASLVQDDERQKYRALLDHNARLQRDIQQAWTQAALPTFECYLRRRMADMAARCAQNGTPTRQDGNPANSSQERQP